MPVRSDGANFRRGRVGDGGRAAAVAGTLSIFESDRGTGRTSRTDGTGTEAGQRKWDTALVSPARASDTMRMTRIRESGREVTLSGALTHHDEP